MRQKVPYVEPKLLGKIILKQLFDPNILAVVLKIVDDELADKWQPCTQDFFAADSMCAKVIIRDDFAFADLVFEFVRAAAEIVPAAGVESLGDRTHEFDDLSLFQLARVLALSRNSVEGRFKHVLSDELREERLFN